MSIFLWKQEKLGNIYLYVYFMVQQIITYFSPQTQNAYTLKFKTFYVFIGGELFIVGGNLVNIEYAAVADK